MCAQGIAVIGRRTLDRLPVFDTHSAPLPLLEVLIQFSQSLYFNLLIHVIFFQLYVHTYIQYNLYLSATMPVCDWEKTSLDCCYPCSKSVMATAPVSQGTRFPLGSSAVAEMGRQWMQVNVTPCKDIFYMSCYNFSPCGWGEIIDLFPWQNISITYFLFRRFVFICSDNHVICQTSLFILCHNHLIFSMRQK